MRPSDSLAQLRSQLAELRGFVRRVPALVEVDRQARWEEIGRRSDDPDVEMIDIYEQEAGPEEGYGFADYATLTYRTAIVTGWEAFRATMSDLLEAFLRNDARAMPDYAASLLDDEIRSFARRFERLVKRYRDWAHLDLKRRPDWRTIQHIEELRNAIVHNDGRYTERYGRVDLAIPLEIAGRVVPASHPLARSHRIPVTAEHAIDALEMLEAVAIQAHDHLFPGC